MKLNNRILISSVLVVLSAVVLIFNKDYISNSYKYDFDNIKLKTLNKGNISLTKEQEKKITKYLKKQDLNETKEQKDCAVFGWYQISFDDYIISFDNSSCVGYLKTKKDYYQIDVSKDLIDYIIKISK